MNPIAQPPTTQAPSGELQGHRADASHPDALREAIELAFNYRGDVTITRASDGLPVEGYIFDRRTDRATGELIIRVIPRSSDERVAIRFSDIATLHFSGKDTASGKSFETWIRKYAEKKLAGEKANIESESLDDA
jgi:hypothetical protein